MTWRQMKQRPVGAWLLGCALCVLGQFAGAAAPPALEAERQGAGPVVLFLGGLNVHGEVWRPWADALAADHRVLVVTPAGFAGVAPTEREGGFLATHVAALGRLLAAEEAEGALVVGHSVGGVAAWDRTMPIAKESIEALYSRQYAGLPAGGVRMVEDALHFLMIDQPAAFESALAAMLAP